MHDPQFPATPPPVPSGKGSRRCRWFYLWYLPLLWLVPVVVIYWVIAGSSHDGNSNGVLLALAALPAVWLMELLWSPCHGNVAAAVALSSCGMFITGVLGLLQDLLRVPRPNRNTAIALLVVPVVIPPYILPMVWPNLVILFGLGSTIVYACLRLAGRP